MNKYIYLFLVIFGLLSNEIKAEDTKMILNLEHGKVEIELFDKIAPNHVKRFKDLAEKGLYNGVVFHRVIDGFMAQTGDVKFGNKNNKDYNLQLAGTGLSLIHI